VLDELYVEAGKYYEQGVLVDDSNAAAWNNLGSIYTALERWDEAVALLREPRSRSTPPYAECALQPG